MDAPELFKYPRTHHVEGSRLQPGDEDLSSISFRELAGRHLVVEEKMDGANSALSFTPGGELLLQSRGHFLTGGRREKHFNRFKQWGQAHAHAFWPALGDRYVMYGEWLYARHTIFYNALPHYFMEFDVLDKRSGDFLDTPRRAELLAGLPVVSVSVLRAGELASLAELVDLLGPSGFIRGEWLGELADLAAKMSLDPDRALAETDASRDMEGLYIKVEESGKVIERYKYIRASFLTTVVQSNTHWLSRPIIPNQLLPGVDLFRAAT